MPLLPPNDKNAKFRVFSIENILTFTYQLKRKYQLCE